MLPWDIKCGYGHFHLHPALRDFSSFTTTASSICTSHCRSVGAVRPLVQNFAPPFGTTYSRSAPLSSFVVYRQLRVCTVTVSKADCAPGATKLDRCFTAIRFTTNPWEGC